MKPVNFDESNRTLKKPPNMTDEECGDLHIFTDGNNCVSCWELDQDDIDEITETGKIWLVLLSGGTQVPVYLSSTKPLHEME